MKLIKFSLLGLCALFIAAGCAVSNTGELLVTMPSDLSLEEVLDRMEKASDPNGFYRKANSYIMRQKVSFKENGVPVVYNVEVVFKRPSLMKTTTYENGKPISTVLFNGETAWNVNPKTGESNSIEGLGLNLVKTFADMGNPANRYTDVFKKIDLSLVNFGGKMAYRLVCHAKDDNIAPYIIFVGKEDFLTKRLETTMYTKQGNYPYVSTINKYALYKGVMIGSESTVATGDVKRDYTIVDYELNPVIPDSEFAVPTAWYNKEPEATPAPATKKN